MLSSSKLEGSLGCVEAWRERCSPRIAQSAFVIMVLIIATIVAVWAQALRALPTRLLHVPVRPGMSSEDGQRQLAAAWKTARAGTLSPWSQALVWGLKHAWALTHKGGQEYGRNTWIAKRVWLEGKPKKHPSAQGVGQLIEKMADPEWFPGKICGSLGGRPKVLSETNQSAIARSAMALKERGFEPTYPLVIAQCPNAAVNPETGEFVSKHVIYSIFESKCYDEDPSRTWAHRSRSSKEALTEGEISKRLQFGKHMESLRHGAEWYFRHVVWTDVCNDVLPLTERKCLLQAQARKGGAGWMSAGSETKSYNLRGKKEQLKLSGSECQRVFWMPILARGKLHLEVLGSSFPGDHPSGMSTFVHKLRAAVQSRFRNEDSQPGIVFVDRGGGFYSGNGKITSEFDAALRENQFTAFHGRDASIQPGRCGDLWLHETAVSWVREQLKRTLPREPWREREEQFAKRLKTAAEHVNARFDVHGLCKEMPERMRLLVHEKKGDRLRK